MKLYNYWRSTTSYRVRIALTLEGLGYETVAVDLIAGAQRSDAYLAVNPIGGVPSLELGDGTVLTQSMAILEYLDKAHPKPALVPNTPIMAAQVRAAANIIARDIHPVNNLKIVSAIKDMGHSQEDTVTWMKVWMLKGLQAYQELLPLKRLTDIETRCLALPTFAAAHPNK